MLPAMSLRDEIDAELRRVTEAAPWNLQSQLGGAPVEGSAVTLLVQTVIPLLNAHREALLKLASAVDALAG